MMFGNYYNGYTPGYYNPMQNDPFGKMSLPQTAMPTQQGTGEIQWVQGEVGAKSYPVAPGRSVILMDSENSVFYIKTLDASGMPLPLRTFDYSERMPAQAQMPGAQPEAQFNPGEFVTRKEFEAAMAQFRATAEQGATNG
jgi:hypothetical protein